MIEVINVYKSFDSKRVLKGVSLEVKDGETLAILGRSGVGKTVFLKLIVGLLKPDRGKILVDGQDITRLSKRELYRLREKFGYVFQSSALFDSLTVYENLALPLRDRGYSEEKISEKIKSVLELVGMVGTEELYPHELSGGMKKRVNVARALVVNPVYIFYDEPTAGLDPVTAERINELMEDLKYRLKKTAILVTHDIKSVMKVADRIVFLSDGKIKEDLRREEIFEAKDKELLEFLKIWKSQ